MRHVRRRASGRDSTNAQLNTGRYNLNTGIQRPPQNRKNRLRLLGPAASYHISKMRAIPAILIVGSSFRYVISIYGLALF